MTLEEFKTKNNIHFRSGELLEQAFVHRSFINENPRSGIIHNERLEFLGDAVLELIVTKYLFERFPNHDEGDLTSYRSALVNAVTLSDVAKALNINDFLKLSKGEAKDISRARSSILADAYEALIGAIYLDLGYEVAERFITETLLGKTDEIVQKGLYKDAKSFVQEKSQELLSITPAYKLIHEEGPDHDKIFRIGIYFGDECVAEGIGKSKQEAETEAAKNALIKKGWVSAN